jgi:hypothetical protein
MNTQDTQTDLLTALQDVLARFEDLLNCYKDSKMNDDDGAILLAHAAIAKAKGN